MRRAVSAAGFAFALGLACLVHGAAPSPAAAGWWDDLDKGEPVPLADLIAEPRRWEGKTVTFACIFHAPDNVFSPYFTSFHAEKFLNFTAWKDGSPLWEQRAFLDDDFPYLYLRRDHPQGPELSRLAPFTRIEITGLVKDVYRERPWIEIKGFRVTPTTLGRRVVDLVKSGDGYASAGDLVSAESHYRAALGEMTLDDTYALRVRKRLADLLRNAGRAKEAAGVEGGAPILGGTRSPAPPPGLLTGARPAAAADAAAAPPAVTTDDALPGSDYAAPTGAAPGAPRPGVGAGTPPPAAPPPAVLGEDDLPGVPADAPKAPVFPVPGRSAAPAAGDPTGPPPPPPPAPLPPTDARPATGPVLVPQDPAPPPSPVTDLPVDPAAPAPQPPPPPPAASAPVAPPPAPATKAPPPPPPARSPRLSGVR
ncbi:MAG: hypothetical protein JNM10_10345 [Planctomycetia bacterium]|nr:hypothetical protein [Planctomycetia bacterium]